MLKREFLARLRSGLYGLPQSDIEERINFYSEMIDDRMEEGLTEEDAVGEMGDASEIASQIISETPLSRLVKEKVKPKREVGTWAAVLLVLGFPLWFPLSIALLSVIFALYVVLWSVNISLWAVDLSFAGVALVGLASAFAFASWGSMGACVVMLALALICAGLTIFMFFGCKAAFKGSLYVTKRILTGTKSMLAGKEAAL